MARYVGSLATYPARMVVLAYLALILVGGLLLGSPLCSADLSKPYRWLDGFFTATSATCVTGLTVRSTGDDYNLLGQWVILLLIQLGGLGIMTVTTMATLTFGSMESLRSRSVLSETLGLEGVDSWGVIRRIAFVFASAEVVGAVLLACRFAFDMPIPSAIYFGVFHSISAFNNAGFGLYNDNLERYVGDAPISLTIAVLVILGGLGFPIFENLRKELVRGRDMEWNRLRFHTKIVLTFSGALLLGGTIAILLLEWNHSLANLSPVSRVLAAFFQSATTRTAGFNTLPITGLTQATLFLMILLMFVGAAPCSTGGGVKVSTVAAMVMSAWARLRGRAEVQAYRRSVPAELIDRATAMILLYLFVVTLGITLLLMVEQDNPRLDHDLTLFRDCVFESFSALGTVGLSTGITAELTPAGKIVIMLLMYIGRIGPITLAVFISREVRQKRVEYAKGNLLIG